MNNIRFISLEASFKRIQFDYVNYRGEAGLRRVIAFEVYWGSTDWHKEPQWLMRAFDLRKLEVRVFALKDMSNVQDLAVPVDQIDDASPSEAV